LTIAAVTNRELNDPCSFTEFKKGRTQGKRAGRFVRSPTLLGQKEMVMQPVSRVPWVLAADTTREWRMVDREYKTIHDLRFTIYETQNPI
jgi:hypothetical protein